MDADVEFQKAISLKSEKKFGQAVDILENLLPELPDSAALYVVLGDAYWEQDELQKAIKCFQTATHLAPTSEIASLGLFNCLWESDEQKAALEEVKRFLKLGDSDDYRDIIREIHASICRD